MRHLGAVVASIAALGLGAAPSGFSTQPDVSDPLCNSGHGVRISAHLGGNPVVATSTMADRSTLIAVSDYGTQKRTVALHSVTPTCLPNRAFGRGGMATIGISARRPVAGLWINAVAPRKGGGAILAGGHGDHWVVGAVTRRGGLDRRFGDAGWAVLPFRGEINAVVQEPSGRILIGGDNAGGGCCTRNWAAALSTRGRLDLSFGRNGRVELPTGEDSGVASLAVEPSGDILAAVNYGNMGCWGVGLAMLSPNGRPVPLFAERLHRFWHRLGFGAFVGDVYIDHAGFTLVGTGQRPCASGPSFSAPSAAGLIARFRTDGKPAGSAIRFPSRLYGAISAFHVGNDSVVVGSPFADPTRLTVLARRADGSADVGFGDRGRASIRTPWSGPNAGLETDVSVTQGGPRTIVIVASRYGRNELRLIRGRV